jgi:hypothetical protein
LRYRGRKRKKGLKRFGNTNSCFHEWFRNGDEICFNCCYFLGLGGLSVDLTRFGEAASSKTLRFDHCTYSLLVPFINAPSWVHFLLPAAYYFSPSFSPSKPTPPDQEQDQQPVTGIAAKYLYTPPYPHTLSNNYQPSCA